MIRELSLLLLELLLLPHKRVILDYVLDRGGELLTLPVYLLIVYGVIVHLQLYILLLSLLNYSAHSCHIVQKLLFIVILSG